MDLTTIAAREQELRRLLKDLRLSMSNKRESLARDEETEAGYLTELGTLQSEALSAFERTRTVGVAVDNGASVSTTHEFDQAAVFNTGAPQ